MSANFIQEKIGQNELADAVRQQEQLAYFTKSDIQGDVTDDYLQAWAQRKYSTDDHFLNYVKSVFKTENFLSFFKYFRQPVASSGLFNDRIKSSLRRVFSAEDSHFRYTIKGESFDSIDELKTQEFDEKLFYSLLFAHNDIVVTNLSDVNKPFRDVVPIQKIVAIDSKDSVISRISYVAEYEGEKGFLYLDDKVYEFYSSDYNLIVSVTHDLGVCPADYIAKEPFTNDIVRMSKFSHLREKLEEYVFHKTLQRMTETNGVVPVITMLKTRNKNDGEDIKGSSDKQPMSSIGSQQSSVHATTVGKGSPLQPGGIFEVQMIKKDDGSIDMAPVKDFITFHYLPTENLIFLKDRIKEIEKDIIISALGNYTDNDSQAKNKTQVSKSYDKEQDKLRDLSMELTRIRTLSDYKFLALQHGKDVVTVDCFYGSDFFLETQAELYDMIEKSPNPIETKSLLIRLTRNKNRFNRSKMEREVLLYHLLPYCSDEDFDKAIERGINSTIFEYQSRFNYWIDLFEATYGDILLFFDSFEVSRSEKIILINNLITNIIKEHEQKNTIDPTLEVDKGK